MSDENLTFYGIDLGTTYSVVSYVDETGRPAVVRNVITNNETTPSVVYFEQDTGEVVVGEAAKNVSRLYPSRVVERVKRSMGKESQWEFDGTTYTPESISALILKQLAQDAEYYTNRPVRKVVITVPAYFGLLERDATRNAGRIAGLDVVEVVPEPVAAALQYDLGKDTARTVLVYDLGGGTFDTTVIRIGVDAVEVLCTDGDQQLGGTDWDARLVQYLVDEFVARAQPAEDPTLDEEFMQDLALTAEEVKRQLSTVTSRKVPMRYAGASASVEVSRETFEEITGDLLNRTIVYTERTLRTLGEKLGVDDPAAAIDEVLLVGGSSKMPAVARELTEKWGWTPRLHDPDLAVAKGAARYALSRAVWAWDGEGAAPTAEEKRERVQALALATGVDEEALSASANKRIVTVLPKSFGVKLQDTTADDWASQPDKYYIEHLVHANESLPITQRELSARTVVEGQTAIEIELHEQAGAEESPELSANKPVDQGKGQISGLPPLPRHSPISITMDVSDGGQLTLHAVEPSSGEKLLIEVQVSLLTEEEVHDLRDIVAGITVRG
ncbi:Hsp70 family protein [Micromonospora noduli]|uniref:Chaperone protein DnaK n=1 Tax=Micromonospora noduli TaxID=709876 RepID=A0ABX9D0D8_9ACTN|nr:Hsp70 family protein [Micromonospora noduli]RAO16295.1 Chaperone protein DnaK [Micromonospora noduli]RAO19873.1 Chaperone protein DnaK [Micromonospora noduli]RAO31956.1 Chaperone protein DnaK [Micromonospora noduli]